MKKTVDDVLPMIIEDINKEILSLDPLDVDSLWQKLGLYQAKDIVIRYQYQIKQEREEALAELTRLSQELGLYDMEKEKGN